MLFLSGFQYSFQILRRVSFTFAGGYAIAKDLAAVLFDPARNIKRTAFFNPAQTIIQKIGRSNAADRPTSNVRKNIHLKAAHNFFGITGTPFLKLLFVPFPRNNLKGICGVSDNESFYLSFRF